MTIRFRAPASAWSVALAMVLATAAACVASPPVAPT